MIKKIFDNVLGRISEAESGSEDREMTIKMATAILMVDVALVDTSFDEAELERMLQLIGSHFGLDTQEAAELINAANAHADDLVSVYEFTKLLNEKLDHDEKAKIVELLWQIAYADGKLDKYENSLVLKISDLLYVSRGRVMGLKHSAEMAAQ